MRFQVNDIVKICSKFTEMDGNKSFPKNREGVIQCIEGDDSFEEYPIKVVFDGVDYSSQNNKVSDFSESELKLVRRAS